MARRSNKKSNLPAGKAPARPATGARPISPAAPDLRGKSPVDGRTLLLCGILFLATLIIFRPCTNNRFLVYDDSDYVTENTHVKQGFTAQSIAWAFKSGEQANWHPLTWLSHILDY